MPSYERKNDSVFPQIILPHPAQATKPEIEILEKEAAITEYSKNELVNALFTDASKQGDSHIGCAVVYKEADSWHTLESRALHKSSSVFRGEIRAISMAVNWINIWANELNGQEHEASILSDSLSGLLALKNPNTLDPELFEIQAKIRDLQTNNNIRLVLRWVPAHENVDGNEAADIAAKLAVYEEIPEEMMWTKSETKIKVQEKATENWQRRWNLAAKGRFTNAIFPKVQFNLAVEKKLGPY
jgi:ribonuclease HI